jgi:hypothetical protein
MSGNRHVSNLESPPGRRQETYNDIMALKLCIPLGSLLTVLQIHHREVRLVQSIQFGYLVVFHKCSCVGNRLRLALETDFV